jgi:hypothetical protein
MLPVPYLIASQERDFLWLFLYVSSVIVLEMGMDNNLAPIGKRI